jgi:hypothetical protein
MNPVVLGNDSQMVGTPCKFAVNFAYVRFGSLADICSAKGHVRFAPNSDRESGFPQTVMSALPTNRTCVVQTGMSAKGQKRTLPLVNCDVRVPTWIGQLN